MLEHATRFLPQLKLYVFNFQVFKQQGPHQRPGPDPAATEGRRLRAEVQRLRDAGLRANLPDTRQGRYNLRRGWMGKHRYMQSVPTQSTLKVGSNLSVPHSQDTTHKKHP